MKYLQKFGGLAALYMAIAHLTGFVIFLVVLDYLNITNPAERVASMSTSNSLSFRPTCSCMCSSAFS